MKVAVCSTGDTLDSQADPRFGRCRYFIAVDTDTLDFTAVQNPGVMSAQGAGIQAAQVVASLVVSAVVAGNFGPNAYQALSAAGVKVYTGNPGTVRQVVEQLKNGQLQEVASPTVAAHFGMGQGPGSGMGMGRGGGGRGRGGR
ncbi:MAG TPA: NifB/NifX family molybdenum-iron cluster-binding protein [Armatimonadota bacterium]|nr:NifB/NifX family molybdenum-iron cluster-binding protein [Armatimonadota bacterium]